MKVLTVYLRLYAKCLTQSFQALRGRNGWTVVLPVALQLGYGLLTGVVVLLRLGFVGGILLNLLMAAIFSLYLSVLGDLVDLSQVSFRDLGQHVFKFFWSVINVLFVVWVANLLLGMVTRGNPQADTLATVLMLIAFIALNATPEVIYQRGTYGGLETLSTALQFIQANWIEWFVPNLAIAAGLYLLEQTLAGLPGPIALVVGLLIGAALHLWFLFRGFLFKALAGSSHRQRMFALRNR